MLLEQARELPFVCECSPYSLRLPWPRSKNTLNLLSALKNSKVFSLPACVATRNNLAWSKGSLIWNTVGILKLRFLSLKLTGWDFPGGPMARLCTSNARGLGSNPGQGTRSTTCCNSSVLMLNQRLKTSVAAKDYSSQINT